MSWVFSTLVAEVYDLDKPIGFSYGDVAYYTRVLGGVSGPILELATGTGRILIPLLQADLDVEGLDHSPEMLVICRRHCRDRGFDPVLHEGDIATFSLPDAYAAVIIPAGSIKNLDGSEAVRQALARCREALRPGGQLIVDLAPPRLVVKPKPLRYWRRDSYLWTLQTVHVDYDAAANQSTEFLRYEKWCDGALVATELHPFCVQHWSIDEFEGMLVEAGFTDIMVTADYQEDRQPGPGNDDWTFHATRPPTAC